MNSAKQLPSVRGAVMDLFGLGRLPSPPEKKIEARHPSVSKDGKKAQVIGPSGTVHVHRDHHGRWVGFNSSDESLQRFLEAYRARESARAFVSRQKSRVRRARALQEQARDNAEKISGHLARAQAGDEEVLESFRGDLESVPGIDSELAENLTFEQLEAVLREVLDELNERLNKRTERLLSVENELAEAEAAANTASEKYAEVVAEHPPRQEYVF